jgi:hypothetical protein
VLKLRENAGRTRTIQIPEEPVEPVIAVEPATLIPDLDEPWPDVFRRRIDDDGHRPGIRRMVEE